MTALAGLWHFDGRPDAAQNCARMLAAQEVYGRHDGAQWSDGDVALGRRLMRVLPEDNFDGQPLIGGGGRYILVADIRLDNREDLAAALGIPPLQASTLCDASILLAALERRGESCLERVVGDYAFAFWDGRRRRLLLGRDPLGQRPLHYHRSKRLFAFASMPKGLHALSEVPYAPNEERIAECLALMPETGSQSFFHGVERVEPGHLVWITLDGLTSRRHWQPSASRLELRRPEDYSETLRALLDQAVKCRLRGTGDVGVYLSGGLDSGAVASTAARLLANSDRRIVAFTGVPREGYDGPIPRNRIINEGPLAAATAALYPNIDHVLVPNEGGSPLNDLDRSFFLFDRPVVNGLAGAAWSNSFTHAVQKRKLKVILGGNLGNMGLSYNGLELLPELLSSGRWLHLLREARALVGSRRMRWRGVMANTLGPWCPENLWRWLNRKINGHSLEIGNYAALNPRRLAELDIVGRAKASNLDLSYRPWKNGLAMRLWALQRMDPGNFRKGGLGGWQLDHRDPTADVRLLEFCLSVPTEQFMRGGVQRSLARRALADRLPPEVLQEHRRGLQVADWHEDLTGARRHILDELGRLEQCAAASRALDLPRLHRLAENWPAGGWERDEVILPYRYALLRAIAVGHFLRRATGANR
jgi:asparagine synthase (glutamine-hydrolysing)